MEELYTTWKAIGVAGGDLSFFQDFFVKFYQAFIEGDRWLQYLNGVKTTLLVTALALILGSASGCAMFQPDDPGYNNPQRAQNIVRTASSQEGKQYRMGGASPSRGFDCSGLIWWASRQNGLTVPRVTVDQARAGYAVPKSSPRPGDIMVFRTSSGPRGLHTGIYAGNNTFIHSPSRGKTVRRENMQPYWGNRLIAVRRIVI